MPDASAGPGLFSQLARLLHIHVSDAAAVASREISGCGFAPVPSCRDNILFARKPLDFVLQPGNHLSPSRIQPSAFASSPLLERRGAEAFYALTVSTLSTACPTFSANTPPAKIVTNKTSTPKYCMRNIFNLGNWVTNHMSDV